MALGDGRQIRQHRGMFAALRTARKLRKIKAKRSGKKERDRQRLRHMACINISAKKLTLDAISDSSNALSEKAKIVIFLAGARARNNGACWRRICWKMDVWFVRYRWNGGMVDVKPGGDMFGARRRQKKKKKKSISAGASAKISVAKSSISESNKHGGGSAGA